jgi:penicillin-binding protein 1C
VNRDRGLWAGLDDISPHLTLATLFSEDRRFLLHNGVDPLALARAVLQNARAGRAVSGGSTVTMQTARLLLGPRPRGFKSKIEEALLAWYLEWRLPKKRILELYLNLAPYAGRNVGCRAASLGYFGIEPRDLAPSQAAWLAVIPRNPSHYDPGRGPGRLEGARLRLVSGMGRTGLLSGKALAAAEEPLAVSRGLPPFGAPHFCDWLLAQADPGGGDIRTTVDSELTAGLESHVLAYVKKLAKYGISNASVVVVRNSDRALLAMVGSADYLDGRISGQVNGAVALRQPGSALKPFTYGLALEKGFPASYLLPDIDFDPDPGEERFIPRNYDERFHGPVRIRTALGCSYNVAAVRMLEQVGQPELLERLRMAGFRSLRRDPDHYGLGLTLGNGEVTLLEMAMAYSALANRGWFRNVRYIEGRPPEAEGKSDGPDSVRVFPEQVAYILAQILSDRSARQPAFGECSPLDLPFPCAAKTGTTKDYRDNWTAGFTADYTVGVWVGMDQKKSLGREETGSKAAAPIFVSFMEKYLNRYPETGKFRVPSGVYMITIDKYTGKLVTPDCLYPFSEAFLPGTEPLEFCNDEEHQKIDNYFKTEAESDDD